MGTSERRGTIVRRGVCNALAGVKAKHWQVGSQSRVGRVTWTGSAWGPGFLLGDSTMYEYYYGG